MNWMIGYDLAQDSCVITGVSVDSGDVYSFLDDSFRELVERLEDNCYSISFSGSDIAALKFNVKGGKVDGILSHYYPDGTLMRQIPYADGIKDGILCFWTDEGNLLSLVEYSNGMNRREYVLNGNGKIERCTNHYGKRPGTKVYSRPRRIPKGFCQACGCN